MKWVWGWR